LRSPFGARGYALITVMFMTTVLLISLTAALPSVYQEGQREKEAELIFRGIQYARAIALFHRQFNRYPVSVKELLQTNGIRFLRKAYLDPMSKKGAWRFIHANAAGVLIDSKTMGPRSNNPLGKTPAGGAAGSATGSAVGGAASSPAAGGTSSPGFQLFGNQTSNRPALQQRTSGFSDEGQDIKGAFIVGVASTSKHSSIRVWNNYSHYDEWEFLGVDMSMLGVPAGIPGLPGGSGQPGGIGQPGGVGTPQTQPRTPGSSGFGSRP
jgi:type II secretory pathway pseudopilin PulG